MAEGTVAAVERAARCRAAPAPRHAPGTRGARGLHVRGGGGHWLGVRLAIARRRDYDAPAGTRMSPKGATPGAVGSRHGPERETSGRAGREPVPSPAARTPPPGGAEPRPPRPERGSPPPPPLTSGPRVLRRAPLRRSGVRVELRGDARRPLGPVSVDAVSVRPVALQKTGSPLTPLGPPTPPATHLRRPLTPARSAPRHAGPRENCLSPE